MFAFREITSAITRVPPESWVPRGSRRQVIPGIKAVLPESDAPVSVCRTRPQPENAPSPMAADGNYPALVRSVRNPNLIFFPLQISVFVFLRLSKSLPRIRHRRQKPAADEREDLLIQGEFNRLILWDPNRCSLSSWFLILLVNRALHMLEEEDFHDYGSDFHEDSQWYSICAN